MNLLVTDKRKEADNYLFLFSGLRCRYSLLSTYFKRFAFSFLHTN